MKRLIITIILISAMLPRPSAEGVTVCILDSGSNMPAVTGWNFATDTEDLADAVGHGTAIHRILIEAVPGAEIYMLKCFESTESIDEDAVVRALYAAVDDYGADVVNMSFTNTVEGEALHDAVVYAYESGTILIAPVGNLGFSTPIGSKPYPAAWDEVIGVGGVNLSDEGEPVPSLWYLTGEMVYVCARADYEGERGTSYAAPRVAAVVANYFQDVQETTQEEVREMLRENARDLGEIGYDETYGWGYIERHP